MFSPDPGIPDSGVKKAPDPGSGSATLVSNKGLLPWTIINKINTDANIPVQVEIQSNLRVSIDE